MASRKCKCRFPIVFLGYRFPIVSAAVCILFLLGFSFSEKAPYSPFVKEATSAPSEMYFDYIVVGGGTAGCALAATLSTASAKVLILERGGLPYNNPDITNKRRKLASLLDLSPTSPAQMFVSTDGVFNHRARVLGGGTAINFGVYSHASSKYVEQAGWDPQLVKESYEWVEKKLVFKPQVEPWEVAVRDGLLEAGVSPYRGFTCEHLPGTKIAGSTFDENGYRHTAADLLEYANSANIVVYLNATAHKILIEASSEGQKLKANGILFKDSTGTTHKAYLKNGPGNEIILSAGTLGSPHLLMLSGIGPAHQLMAHGISVILDQPLVGQEMSDNPFNGVVIPSLRPLESSISGTVGITEFGNIIEQFSQDYAELANLVGPIPQTVFEAINASNSLLFQKPNIQLGLFFEKVIGPFSQGYMELQSKDPNDNPRVTFNYFQDTRDLERCVRGIEIIKQVVESKPLAYYRYPFMPFQSLMNLMLASPLNLRKKHPAIAHSLQQYCIDTVMTMWHFHGGCLVDKVVDHDYKVIGVDALRVVDASTFNNTPGTNPQATIMMLGRYVGQHILHQIISNSSDDESKKRSRAH